MCGPWLVAVVRFLGGGRIWDLYHLSRLLCNKVHPADVPPHCFVCALCPISPYWFLEFPRFLFVQTVVASGREIFGLPYNQYLFYHKFQIRGHWDSRVEVTASLVSRWLQWLFFGGILVCNDSGRFFFIYQWGKPNFFLSLYRVGLPSLRLCAVHG